jgi:hypothetical protein
MPNAAAVMIKPTTVMTQRGENGQDAEEGAVWNFGSVRQQVLGVEHGASDRDQDHGQTQAEAGEQQQAESERVLVQSSLIGARALKDREPFRR